MIIQFRYAVIVLAALSGMIIIQSCTPSVRYIRSSQQNEKTGDKVSSKWDLRKKPRISKSRFTAVISSYIGIPYRYGGMSRRGLDCSGFVCLVFLEVNRTKLPHSTKKMRRYGKVIPLQQAHPGDLVFFRNKLGAIDHVGIFMGDGRFAHASTRKGVIYSNLDDVYYSRRLSEVRRIL